MLVNVLPFVLIVPPLHWSTPASVTGPVTDIVTAARLKFPTKSVLPVNATGAAAEDHTSSAVALKVPLTLLVPPVNLHAGPRATSNVPPLSVPPLARLNVRH